MVEDLIKKVATHLPITSSTRSSDCPNTCERTRIVGLIVARVAYRWHDHDFIDVEIVTYTAEGVFGNRDQGIIPLIGLSGEEIDGHVQALRARISLDIYVLSVETSWPRFVMRERKEICGVKDVVASLFPDNYLLSYWKSFYTICSYIVAATLCATVKSSLSAPLGAFTHSIGASGPVDRKRHGANGAI